MFQKQQPTNQIFVFSNPALLSCHVIMSPSEMSDSISNCIGLLTGGNCAVQWWFSYQLTTECVNNNIEILPLVWLAVEQAGLVPGNYQEKMCCVLWWAKLTPPTSPIPTPRGAPGPSPARYLNTHSNNTTTTTSRRYILTPSLALCYDSM